MSNKSIVYALAFLSILTILFINLASAQEFWSWWAEPNIQGNSIQTMGSSRFDLNYSIVLSNDNGYNTNDLQTIYAQYNYQPIIRPFANSSANQNIRMIIPNGNYIEAYDNALNLLESQLIGYKAQGQIQLTDWDEDGSYNDVVGIYEISSGNYSFFVYSYNITDNNFYKIYEDNFQVINTSAVYNTGVRCISNNPYWNSPMCLSVFSTTNSSNSTHPTIAQFYFFNNTGHSNNRFNMKGEFVYELPTWDDIDKDNKYEYLLFSRFTLLIVNDSGGEEYRWDGSYNSPTYQYVYIDSPKFIRVDGSGYIRIALNKFTTKEDATANNYGYAEVWRADGSVMWSKQILGLLSVNAQPHTYGMAISDYNGDGYEDMWFGLHYVTGASYLKPFIIEGKNGNVLQSSTIFLNGYDFASYGRNYPFGYNQLILANMDNDNSYDMIFSGRSFIGTRYRTLAVYSPAQNKSYLNIFQNGSNCVPVDFNFDGNLDLVCSNNIEGTIVYSTNYINTLPTLNLISISPSLSVQVGTTLNALIQATDTENNAIVYAHRCDTDENLSNWDFSSTKNCLYDTIGIKNLTIYISDAYHNYLGSEFVSQSLQVIVSQTGQTCNNNGICESGESNINCPNDCYFTGVNYTQTEGGMSLPTQLVDTTGNTETGLLPEIYYGTLAFFSNTLQPIIILGFLILSVFIIIGVGFVIKRIVEKVKQL
jgi:hypothetical protein